jgi:hypothetical protein
MNPSHTGKLPLESSKLSGATTKRKTIIEICCALLIILFIYAGLTKLITYEKFRWDLLGHKVLVPYAHTIAWAIPGFEILIAFLLLIKKTRVLGLYLSFGLLAIFTAYIIYMFNFYELAPCSCGGVISKLSWGQHVVFNIFFTVLSLIAIFLTRKGRAM